MNSKKNSKNSLTYFLRIEKLITSKIDLLQPAHSLILRVCSCISTRFDLEIVSAVLPLNITKNELVSEVEKRREEREGKRRKEKRRKRRKEKGREEEEREGKRRKEKRMKKEREGREEGGRKEKRRGEGA